jgi:hypothetical protein
MSDALFDRVMGGIIGGFLVFAAFLFMASLLSSPHEGACRALCGDRAAEYLTYHREGCLCRTADGLIAVGRKDDSR